MVQARYKEYCRKPVYTGMFTFSTKRQWAPDGSIDSEDMAIREKKRLRPLTLRTPPDTCQTNFCEANQLPSRFRLSSLTPVESSDDDSDGPQLRHHNATSLQELPFGSSSASAMDVDTLPPSINGDDLSPSSMSAQYNGSVQPSPIPHSLVNQSLNIDGPVATNQAPLPTNPDSTVTMNHDFVPGAGASGLYPEAARNHDTVCWTLPGIPSPISEDEDVCVTGTDTPTSDTEMPYTPFHPASSHSYDIGQDQTQWNNPSDIQAPSSNDNTSREEIKSSIPVANTASNKKKVNIFMGYRADCDKCRQKMPGHYSHIIHL